MKRLIGIASLALIIGLGHSNVTAQTLADMPPPPPAPPVLRPAVAPTVAATRPAPEKEPEFDENDTVRVSTSLITVPAEVLDRNDLLAATPGTTNLILFDTDLMGTFGTVSIDPGVDQTAYGVFGDLVSLLPQSV